MTASVLSGYFLAACLQYLCVGVPLLLIAGACQSVRVLHAVFWLLVLFLFNSMCLLIPAKLIFSQYLHWNFVGKFLEFIWPLILIYGFKWLSPEAVGLKWPKGSWDFALGITLGVIFALLACGVDRFLVEDAASIAAPTQETVLFQFTLPGFSEELLYRGFFLALLYKYLPENRRINWGIILVSILFAAVHLIQYLPDQQRLSLRGPDPDYFYLTLSSISLLSMVLAYLRIKTDSIWPGVVCHNLVNGLYFALRSSLSS